MGVSSSSLLRTTTEAQTSYGGLAQLARAPALHAGGQRFESVILHNKTEVDITGGEVNNKTSNEIFDILNTRRKAKEVLQMF